MDLFETELKRLDNAGLKRILTRITGPSGHRVVINGKEAICLCSNDYLGLANDPLLKKAACQAVEAFGTGAGASRLVSGTMEPHVALEDRIKKFKGAEAALLFNSGYVANLAVITALADRQTDIFSDRSNHASIVDACLASRARVKRYANRSADSLEGLLRKSAAKRKIVITEGVFSMDGGVAPLPEISALVERYGAHLLLDDAHSFGVLGLSGRGTLEHFKLRPNPFTIEIGTLGKAAGSFGAFVTGPAKMVEFLISKARPFIYTTALPPAVCAASTKAVDMMDERPYLRERLWSNTRFLRNGLKEAGFDTLNSGTQIMPVIIGKAGDAVRIKDRLLERGVFIQAIRPPTVPEGSSRLRVTVSATHSKADLTHALGAIKEAFATDR